MSARLPNELLRQILELGIRNSKFTYKDLCCISISCKVLHELSTEDSLWSQLISYDFPPNPNDYSSSSSNSISTSASSAKSTYKIRFEKEKERKVLAHRRAVLRKESEVLEFRRKIRDIENRLRQENDKMRITAIELSNINRVRQASVALNVWQPEVIRGRQKQIVEQCAVPVESRVHSLEMELKLCRQQIAGLDGAYRDEKRRLERAKEELASMKYHPLRDYRLATSRENERNKKRKKLKACANFPEKQGKTS